MRRLTTWLAVSMLGVGIVLETLLITSQENNRHRIAFPAGILHVRWGDSTTKVVSVLAIVFILVSFLFAVGRHWYTTAGLVLAGALLLVLEWWHDLPWPQNQVGFWLGFLIGALWMLASALRNADAFQRAWNWVWGGRSATNP